MNGPADSAHATPIGGYFELTLPNHGWPFPPTYLAFQSGRAALRALLESSPFERVLIPAYTCDSVVSAVEDAGRVVTFYPLDEGLAPRLGDSVKSDTVLLYINYFGLCDHVVSRLASQFTGQLIVDDTQALLAAPTGALGTIYSPRKFTGLPDGGLLVANGLVVPEPVDEDDGSLQRMDSLLIRLAGSAREGYAAFVAANHTLEDTRPRRMSHLTRRLLRSVDMQDMKQRRRVNFARLAKAFDALNARRWTLSADCVPLCYPLVLRKDVREIRQRLAENDIFIPIYWEDARLRLCDATPEMAMLDNCLALPCDQRYSIKQMDHLIRCVVTALDGP